MVQNYFDKEHSTVSALKVLAIWQGKQNHDQISFCILVRSRGEDLTRVLFLATLIRSAQKVTPSILK